MAAVSGRKYPGAVEKEELEEEEEERIPGPRSRLGHHLRRRPRGLWDCGAAVLAEGGTFFQRLTTVGAMHHSPPQEPCVRCALLANLPTDASVMHNPPVV